MKPSDKLQVASNIRQQGFDITKQLLAPIVSQVEAYADRRRLEPSDERIEGAVQQFIQEDKNRFIALLNNGQKVQISQQAYLFDATYNFLPSRYKTLKI